jgi:hypothetical protein
LVRRAFPPANLRRSILIRYALRCPEDHRFESWFRSSVDFDKLMCCGKLTCPECGSPRIGKALMAPSVSAAEEPVHPLARLRRRIDSEADYVGRDFPSEARAIHAGTSPDRPIWGEARAGEALQLLRDGIFVAPLPILPRSKVN